MTVLLVHGMGRTRVSMWRLALALRRSGATVHLFGYSAAREPVPAIVRRLTGRLRTLSHAPYVVVGHSLGGLLLRAAIDALPGMLPRPERLIMLGTPNHSPRLARRFHQAWWYRWLNGDAGELLADDARLQQLPLPDVPCTVVAGTRGLRGRWSPFGEQDNDGLVALDEAYLATADEWITVPARHPFLMNHPQVRALVRARLASAPALPP